VTPFAVDWAPAATAALATIWMQATDRTAVTSAQHRIDQLLEQDPFRNGRHRCEGLFIIKVAPLACAYTIDLSRNLVLVSAVWRSP